MIQYKIYRVDTGHLAEYKGRYYEQNRICLVATDLPAISSLEKAAEILDGLSIDDPDFTFDDYVILPTYKSK